MNERLWMRRWFVDVGPPDADGTRYEGMRLDFRVRLAASKPTSGDITVYAPDPALVDALFARGTLVRIGAGYADNGATVILQGGVVRDSVRDRSASRDRRVTWQVAPLQGPVSSATLIGPTGATTTTALIEAVRAALGVPAEIIQPGRVVRYGRGYVLTGSPIRELEQLCRDSASQWSLTDGRLRVWPAGASARQTADVWSERSGLIESARPGGDGRVGATALLRPTCKPGDVIRVESEAWTGDITVAEVYHEGDNEGNRWYTSAVGVPRA